MCNHFLCGGAYEYQPLDREASTKTFNKKFLPGGSRCYTGAVFSKSAPPGRRRQEGSLLKIMNDEPHPYDIKRNAKIILASAS